ncbi:MAG TPA: hypothetical protein VGF82_27060 [Terracidiphilus sp.]
MAAWLVDLHEFRARSFVERLFWSIPASLAISTISAVLIGKFFSLSAVVFFFALSALSFCAIVCIETIRRSKSGTPMVFGLKPGGSWAAVIVFLWIVFTIASLVDFQRDQRLYLSLTFFDHGARVNWAESILRTGIPPANPDYFAHHPASLRYYYFWLVDCAAVARMSHISMRAVMIASCIWSALCIVAVLGLYLKHFLHVGDRLRPQLLIAVGLLAVTGPYIAIDLWDMVIARKPPPGLEVWPEGQITSWLDNFFFYPHHTVALACCMFGFLLAWMANKQSRRLAFAFIIIGMSFASAFGLSVYVAFAFFLIMLIWGTWQLAVERTPGPVVNLAIGASAAALLLIPYLRELTQGTSRMQGGSVFGFAVRETISPGGVLALPLMRSVAVAHPALATNLARLFLMIPGYSIELGFYFIVLALFVIALWRSRSGLNPAHRALLIIALAAFPCISFIRSEVLNINDFGIHGGMFIEFPLLLLASELLMIWRGQKAPSMASVPVAPRWLISPAKVLAGLGVLSTIYIAFMLRFGILVLPDTPDHSLSHKAYIAARGYAHLDSAVPREAVVQFNPSGFGIFWKHVDLINVNRQVAILEDQQPCGAELGGDPSACSAMSADIAPLFQDASADRARNVCRTYGIHYLIANIYDPAWRKSNSWVWTLNPVVADPEFRALDCNARQP